MTIADWQWWFNRFRTPCDYRLVTCCTRIGVPCASAFSSERCSTYDASSPDYIRPAASTDDSKADDSMQLALSAEGSATTGLNDPES